MMDGTFKKKVIVGAVAAAALAAGGAAIAGSQSGSSADEQAILNDAAQRLGIEPAELRDALEHGYAEQVDAAVAAGELTEEEGQALKERIEAGEIPLVGGPLHHDRGHGFRLFGGPAAAASFLGLTEAELRAELESGKTLAEIATENGKSADGLEQALLDAAKADIAAAVAAGRLTEAEQQAILADLPQRIEDLVNGELPAPHGRGFGEKHRDVGAPEPSVS